MKLQALRKKEGFSLIELIVVLVVAAVVAAGVTSFLGPALNRRGLPLQNLQFSGQLRSIMENITNDYNRFTGVKNHATLVTLQGRINNCATTGYGNCAVVNNRFVAFNAFNQEIDDPTPSTGRTLKVTIRLNDARNMQTLTTYFTAD